jgi:hypothetical protein
MRNLLILTLLAVLLAACGESVEPVAVEPKAKQPFEKNATDAAGVAEGDEQVSPFGKPAH